MNTSTTDTPRVENYLQNFNSQFVPAELARNLERELIEKTNEVAKLREELKERIETQSTFALALLEKPEREVARLREIVERCRVWATSENPTQMELDDLKQKYDELN